ncbi:DsbA family protein [Oceaniglobus ichthyenteri]|uniref:DsbA family protein n=1 Tax=Oceaniglobus ichthyenteri TaxID=2136177 RepID=UPI000D3A1AF8|nr:DsbA family protein [Oceaniglobus ichthyenteri]
MKQTTRRNLLLGAVATTGAAGIIGVARFPGATQAKAQELTVEDVLFDPVNPVLGNPDGDLTIVEFFDYQCPYCKANHPDLMDVTGADGNIRLVMKDWPIFGAPSVRASQLALGAVDVGAYETVLAALMATKGRLSEADITATLETAGLDLGELDGAYRANRGQWDGLMARNDFQAAQLGLRGTPAYIIGTTIYPGTMNRAELKEAIANARA